MNKFYSIAPKKKKEIIEAVSLHHNLPAFAVEKDWWVVQVLSVLFKSSIGNYLVFKGGTSLSKAWNLIERFSEDVDIAIDRKFFGYTGVLSKSQRTKLRKDSNLYIRETLLSELEKEFYLQGLTNVHLILGDVMSSDQDPVIINVNYPNVISSPGYIHSRVQIEIGCRSLKEPFEIRNIYSLIDDTFPDADFALSGCQIPTVLPERTYLEKIFLLHEEFQRPKEKRRVNRLSRHLYDLYQLSKSEYAKGAVKDEKLYTTIVKHRQLYTRMGGVNYNLHQPNTIWFLPPASVLSEWENDYNTMKETMIYGESPSFEELILHLEHVNHSINQLAWRIKGDLYDPKTK